VVFVGSFGLCYSSAAVVMSTRLFDVEIEVVQENRFLFLHMCCWEQINQFGCALGEGGLPPLMATVMVGMLPV